MRGWGENNFAHLLFKFKHFHHTLFVYIINKRKIYLDRTYLQYVGFIFIYRKLHSIGVQRYNDATFLEKSATH